jgi:ATPase subunit of ABC transporter with duplicated ATPase domains
MTRRDTIKKRRPTRDREEPEESDLVIVRFDNPKKAAMIKALIDTLGVVSPACAAVRISRQAHYRWLREDEDYRRTVAEMGEIALDFAENKLMRAMEKNDLTAVIFYLKTKGKSRGYIERMEFTPQMKPTINMEKLSEGERKKLYELLDAASDDEL